MDSTMWLEGLGRRDTEIAGGKGANLGELIAAGFRVPAGFVVTAEAVSVLDGRGRRSSGAGRTSVVIEAAFGRARRSSSVAESSPTPTS